MRRLAHLGDVREVAQPRLVLGAQQAVSHRHRRRDARADLEVLVAHRDGAREGEDVRVHPGGRDVGPERGTADPEALRSAGGALGGRLRLGVLHRGREEPHVELGRHGSTQLRRRQLAEDDGQHPRLVAGLEGHFRRDLHPDERARAVALERYPFERRIDGGESEPLGRSARNAQQHEVALAHHLARRDALGRQHAERRPEIEGRGAHGAHLGLLGARDGRERERRQGCERPLHGASARGCVRRSKKSSTSTTATTATAWTRINSECARSACARPTAPRPMPSVIR